MFILDVACYRRKACAVPLHNLVSYFFYPPFTLSHKSHSGYEKKKTVLCMANTALMYIFLFTESQNVWGWKGPLWVI